MVAECGPAVVGWSPSGLPGVWVLTGQAAELLGVTLKVGLLCADGVSVTGTELQPTVLWVAGTTILLSGRFESPQTIVARMAGRRTQMR